MRRPHKPGGEALTQAPRRADNHLMPTLLDRLRDDAPDRLTEAPSEYTVTRAQLREIIQRDLAFLLNATNLGNLIDEKRYKHAAKSTANFGVPPLAGAFMATRKWSDIESAVKTAIINFEPRLIADTIKVIPAAGTQGKTLYNSLAFEIHGMIRMDPYPLEFMVQSSLDLETSRLHAGARAR
ncbi:type VI secretion system baseplate subunit TssE [Paraburkholderia tropica]|uniref:type VI secretion system baseplate subunit TssE n=1 Tax=Paraburkholderia tropica TaxID=92647 RepID=UPI0015FFC241|nr:type VI secretion system baseplate subunit TssE [Paraburkholderia tropica]QNB14642.1 type VI secretion system baseplate subunit TssE [Paraburkholderia tropica]